MTALSSKHKLRTTQRGEQEHLFRPRRGEYARARGDAPHAPRGPPLLQRAIHLRGPSGCGKTILAKAPRSPALLLTRCRVILAPAAGIFAFAICHEPHRGGDHGCARRMVVILSEARVHSLRHALGTMEEIDSGGPGS